MESVLLEKSGGQAAVLVPGGAPEALNCDKGEVGRGGSALGQVRVPGEADPQEEEGLCQTCVEVWRLVGAHLLLWGSKHLRQGDQG